MKTNKKMIETVMFYLAIILVFVGGFGFLRGFLTSIGTVKSEKTFERLPLGDLRGIAVDNDGRVYCGLQFYGRVQVYNNQGKFPVLFGEEADEPAEVGMGIGELIFFRVYQNTNAQVLILGAAVGEVERGIRKIIERFLVRAGVLQA